jgi:hypothetical protein
MALGTGRDIVAQQRRLVRDRIGKRRVSSPIEGQDLHRAVRALAEWADYWMPEDSDDWTVSSKAEREATQRTARVARRNGG